MPRADTFRHEVAFYDDTDAYLSTAIPFLREGLAAGEPTMVALGPEKTELVRGALGPEADEIRFVDIEELGRNPARLLPAWREFAAEQPDGSTLRGLGEPVWPGRDAAEVDECHRHEALLNEVFGEAGGISLLCPYDSRALPDHVLQEALRTHPEVAGRDGAGLPSPSWDEGPSRDPLAGELRPRPADAPEFRFELESLHELRGFVARAAASAGISDERAEDAILAASEVAANSIVHGGGMGQAYAWNEGGALHFESRDSGQITEPLVGRVRPTPTQVKGRGLWMANQLCDLVQIRSSDAGTVVRLRLELD